MSTLKTPDWRDVADPTCREGAQLRRQEARGARSASAQSARRRRFHRTSRVRRRSGHSEEAQTRRSSARRAKAPATIAC